MIRVAFVFGTRPEVIKLAPVILALKKIKKLQIILISTGQHDELQKEALEAFNLKADLDLKIMKHGQTLSYILSSAIAKLETTFSSFKPNFTFILGDTSSTLAGALVSFYNKVPVVHIEAGGRSHRIYEPFPEEAHRRLIAAITSWHFSPTRKMEDNLIHEGHDRKRIFVVGSTEPDAVDWILKNRSSQSLYKIIPNIKEMKHIVVITTHRRESWGMPMKGVFSALRFIIEKYPEIYFIYSIHPNPLIHNPAKRALAGLDNLQIIPHIAAVPFIHLINKASLIMTDSGGVQPQAGTLIKPVIVLRNVTEWSELIEKGIGRLVGTDEQSIITAFEDYVKKIWPKKLPYKPVYPKGAADKIVSIFNKKILV